MRESEHGDHAKHRHHWMRRMRAAFDVVHCEDMEPLEPPQLMPTSDRIENHPVVNGSIEIAPEDEPRELIRRNASSPHAVLSAFIAWAIAINIDLTPLFGKAGNLAAPRVTCGIRTTFIVFKGSPGQSFKYAGDTYTFDESGVIELIADEKATSFTVNGRKFEIAGPRDQFGAVHVDLPEHRHARIY
jgi:hypothetical protein